VAFEVVDFKTDEVVHRVEVKEVNRRLVDRIEAGLLRKTDTERFFVREVHK
jgi:hypothetical protein